MLKVLRDNLKYLSWILWIVILVFILFVFVDFGAGINNPNSPSSAAASVGSTKISIAEFRRAYQRAENQYRKVYGAKFTPELEKKMRLPIQVLNELVSQTIMLKEAQRVGLMVSDSEVRQAILQMRVFKDKQGGFVGDEAYKQILASNGLTPDIFESEMRKDLMLNKLRELLAHNAYVSEQEIKSVYTREADHAEIRFIRLPIARFASKAQASDQQLESYFDAHKEAFRLPEQRVVHYLLVDPRIIAGQTQVSKAQEEKYYNAHKTEFAQPEEVHARHILIKVGPKRTDAQAKALIEKAKRRIENGESFAKVAREVSEDPGSKARGGDLGYFPRNRMVKPFADAAFAAKPHQLVGPIRTSFGYHLIEVLDHRAASQRSFSAVKSLIRMRLASETAASEAKKRAEDLAAALKNKGKVDEQAMRQAAQSDPAVIFASTPPFGRDSEIAGIGRSGAFNAAAFNLTKGQLSDPVHIARGWAILQLASIVPPHLPTFKEAQSAVRAKVEAESEQQIATQKLAEAKKAIAAGKTLDEVAKQLGVSVQQSGEFSPNGIIPGLGMSTKITDLAMSLNKGDIGGPVSMYQTEVLFQVTGRQRATEAGLAAKREQIRNQIEQEKVGRLMASLLAKRRDDLNVNYSKQLLKSFGLLNNGQPSKQG